MPEPITMTLVGATVITEGVKFLYGQVSELLKRLRERKNATPPPAVTADVKPLPDIFEGQLQPLQIHFDKADALEPKLRELRDALTDDGPEFTDATPTNAALLAKAEALRDLLETVYQQRLTFKGENRPASGPFVKNIIDIKTIEGEATGVDVETVKSGSIDSHIKADTLTKDGKIVGVKIGTLG